MSASARARLCMHARARAGGDGATQGKLVQCNAHNKVECGLSFTDAGAVCIDMHDSFDATAAFSISKTALVPTTSAIAANLTSAVGAHEIAYACVDGAGNTGPLSQATRTVQVVDTTAPQIAINGDSLVQLSSTDPTNEETIQAMLMPCAQSTCGYSCTDSCAGNCDALCTTTEIGRAHV